MHRYNFPDTLNTIMKTKSTLAGILSGKSSGTLASFTVPESFQLSAGGN